MPDVPMLEARRAATERTLARFRDKPFDWRTRANCVPLLRQQLIEFGHQPPPLPQYRSALGAARALRRAGYVDLRALVDAQLPGMAIAPARMWIGDVALVAGEPPFGMALTIFAGGSKLLGWHGADLSRMLPFSVASSDIVAAWRIELR